MEVSNRAYVGKSHNSVVKAPKLKEEITYKNYRRVCKYLVKKQ